MRALLCLIAGSACHAHPRTNAPAAPVAAGVAISLYSNGDASTAYGVVDDRRWVELSGSELVLEPLDAAPLAIERCAREALPVQAPPPAKPAPPAPKRRVLSHADALADARLDRAPRL